MGAPLVIAGVGLALQLYGMDETRKGAKESAQAQKESIAAQGRQANVEAQRARIAQVREARIRRAQVIASTQGTMGPGTSGVSGATGSITSQENSNIGIINQTQTFAEQASKANQRAADAGARMNEGQAWSQLGGSIFQTGTTIFGFKGGFGKGKPSV